MDKKLHDELLSETEKLRKLIVEYSTRSVVGSCYFILHPQFNTDSDEEKYPKLTSKVKQIFFLLGLMLTTEEPKNAKDFGKENWKDVAKLLESIFNKYFFHFLQSSVENIDKSDELLEKHEVVMKYFLSYFSNGLLASFEQVVERIKLYLIPFDVEIESIIGISASDSLKIAEWIHNNLQKKSDDLTNSFLNFDFNIMQSIYERSVRETWTLEKSREEVKKAGLLKSFNKINDQITKLAKIKLKEIENTFGEEKATAFWKNFVSKRGEFNRLQYITDRNIAEEKSLFEVEKDTAFCIVGNVLYWAVLKVCEQTILENQTKQSYEKKRGKLFDKEVEKLFRDYFPSNALIFSNVYETQDLQNEHDLIILWGKRLFIIENKSSPPNAPFRDPEKSFTRIEREFQTKPLCTESAEV